MIDAIKLKMYANPSERNQALLDKLRPDLLQLGYELQISDIPVVYARVQVNVPLSTQRYHFWIPRDLYDNHIEYALGQLQVVNTKVREQAMSPLYAVNQSSGEKYTIALSDRRRELELVSFFSMFELGDRLRYLVQQWGEVVHAITPQLDFKGSTNQVRKDIRKMFKNNYIPGINDWHWQVHGLMEVLADTFVGEALVSIRTNQVVDHFFTYGRGTQEVIKENHELLKTVFFKIATIILTKFRGKELETWQSLDLDSLKKLVRRLGVISNGFLRLGADGIREEYFSFEQVNGVTKVFLNEIFYEEIRRHNEKKTSFHEAAEAVMTLLAPYKKEILAEDNIGHSAGKQGVCPVSKSSGQYEHIYDKFTDAMYQGVLMIFEERNRIMKERGES